MQTSNILILWVSLCLVCQTNEKVVFGWIINAYMHHLEKLITTTLITLIWPWYDIWSQMILIIPNDKVWIWTLSHWCGKLKNRYLDSRRKISLKSCFLFLSSTEIYRLFRHCPESQQPPLSSCNFWFKSPNLQIELFPAKIVHGSHLTNYMRLSIEEHSVSTSKGRGSAPTCSLNDERSVSAHHPSFITHLLPSHGVKNSCRS